MGTNANAPDCCGAWFWLQWKTQLQCERIAGVCDPAMPQLGCMECNDVSAVAWRCILGPICTGGGYVMLSHPAHGVASSDLCTGVMTSVMQDQFTVS